MDNANIDVKALFSITYGLYIVSSASEGKLNGQIANAAMQITSSPACLTICLNKANLTTEIIKNSGIFSLSVLESGTPMTFIGKFGFKSGRSIEKFIDTEYETWQTGAPVVTQYSVAALEARVTGSMDLPTHMLFVGEVVSSRFFKDESPLTYADYHRVKKGKSPKTAPTFEFNGVN